MTKECDERKKRRWLKKKSERNIKIRNQQWVSSVKCVCAC